MYVAVAANITLVPPLSTFVMYTQLSYSHSLPDCRWAYGICLWEVFSFGKCEVLYNPLQLAWECGCYCGTIHQSNYCTILRV